MRELIGLGSDVRLAVNIGSALEPPPLDTDGVLRPDELAGKDPTESMLKLAACAFEARILRMTPSRSSVLASPN